MVSIFVFLLHAYIPTPYICLMLGCDLWEEKGTTWEACLETDYESVHFKVSKMTLPWKYAMTSFWYSCLHLGFSFDSRAHSNCSLTKTFTTVFQ